MTPEELDAVADVIAETVQPLIARIKELEATKGIVPADYQHLSHRLKVLEEQPRMVYRGIFDATKSYEPGDITTHSGSSWHCREATRSVPGGPSAASRAWVLMVKAGRDGKDVRA